MSQLEVSKAEAAEERSEQTRSFVRTVKAAARRKYTPEEKIRIVLEGFRHEGILTNLPAPSLYSPTISLYMKYTVWITSTIRVTTESGQNIKRKPTVIMAKLKSKAP